MSNSYKVTVIAGTRVVAEMAQKVSQSTIEASLELKPITGGATEATAVLMAPPNPLPVNSNRKRTKAIGWYKNATGPAWEAPKEADNTNWWSYETGLWSLGSSIPYPVDENSVKKDSVKIGTGKNKLDKSKLTNGYMNNIGVVGSNPGTGETTGVFYVYSDFIPTDNGKSYHGEGDSNSTGTTSNPSINGYFFRFVTFFDKDKVLIPSTTVTTFTPNFTVPSDLGAIKYFRASFLKSNTDSFQIEDGNTKSEYESYTEEIVGIDDRKIANTGKTFAEKSTVYNKQESDNKFATSELLEIQSRNVADTSISVGGRIVNSLLNGGPTNTPINVSASAANWRSLYFPIDSVNNTHIAISGWLTSRTDIYFGKGAFVEGQLPSATMGLNQLIKSGSLGNLGLGNKIGGKIIIPLEPNQTWLGLNLKNDTEDSAVFEKLMISYGQEFFDYEPHSGATYTVKVSDKVVVTDSLLRNGRIVKTSDLILKGEIPKSGAMKLTVKADTNTDPTLIDFIYNGNVIQHRIRPYRVPSLISSQAFEFYQTSFNGITVHNTNDDGTPYRFNDYTLGANHGYAKSVVTMLDHGKQNVDVGSVWTTGTKQFVLTNVIDANTFEVSSRSDNSSLGSATTLTHVSGATNTAMINVGSVVHNGHLFPVMQNLIRRLYLDGIEVDRIENGEYYANKTITFTERYEIMNKNSMMEWLITQVGSEEKILQFHGTSEVSVSNTFVFDSKMGCTEYQDFVSLRDGIKFQDIMFLQVYYGGIDGPIIYYIPKTKPIPYKAVNYDFTNKVNMSLFSFESTGDNLNFTPEYTETNGLLADRVVKLQNSIGYAVGFIPVRSNSPENRRTNAARKALQIRGTKKIYMSAIDSADIITLNSGDYFSSIGYRKFFELVSNRTDYYTIDTTEGSFVYADWHSATVDNLKLEGHLLGRKMTIVDKSNTVNILTPNPTDSVVVDVQAKGFLVLKFD